jgi:hypothetical protein
MPKINNIVLVHGGFVDGAGWRGVYDVLKKDGFNVSPVRKSASAPLSWQALKVNGADGGSNFDSSRRRH